MYPLLVFHRSRPDPKLADKITRQQECGGHLVLYRWAWSLLFFTVIHARIDYIPYGRSRIMAGFRYNLATLVLGIWNPFYLVVMPVLLIANFRGGIDVTAQFSDASVHPFLDRPPDPDAMQNEENQASWVFVAFGLGIAVILLIFFRKGL